MPESARYFQSVGRRKEAVARIRLLPGKGMIMVNGKPITEVYQGQIYETIYQKPFVVTKTAGKYSATIKVLGGGRAAQLEAIVHGFARALVKADPDFRTSLREFGLLTRDPRARERRKYGLAHAARAQKSSPKR